MLERISQQQEIFWQNPHTASIHTKAYAPNLSLDAIKDADARLRRFADYFAHVFPATQATQGLIESELISIDGATQRLAQLTQSKVTGKVMLKLDSHLPISGSIKARGGIYEILVYAESLAKDAGLLLDDMPYRMFATSAFRQLFSQHTIVVGSTGNLGLSIGIISAQLGFQVTVHMSSDAKGWKKQKLREVGANVVEHQEDYGKAVELGREQAQALPNSYFVDDENSIHLFIGYATAALRLQRQLAEQGVTVDEAHPLFVYLPCGIGGAPGGITWGLKHLFDHNVHCIFAEPTLAPCMLLGMMTGKHDQISSADVGIKGQTIADGLAVHRPSGFVGQTTGHLINAIYTLDDHRMSALQAIAYQSEKRFLEPSAVAGLMGPIWVHNHQHYADQFSAEQLRNATHIVWATGGSMVPEAERQRDLNQAQVNLQNWENWTQK